MVFFAPVVVHVWYCAVVAVLPRSLPLPLISPWPRTLATAIILRTALVSEMNPVIWVSQLDQGKPERTPSCFFSFLYLLFYLLPGPLGLFVLLFRDASVLTPRSEAAHPQELFRSVCLDALSVWFPTHTGLCHSPRTQPSLTLTYM